MKLLTIFGIIVILASGCIDSFGGNRTITYKAPADREWTFIVYMAADNDLEAAALADFNELEAVNFSGKPVSVLVLLDRSPGYDATNGDWTDTRLYEIATDTNGNNATLISPRIACPDLGLTAAENTELDMSDPLVLSRVIDFAKREYTAAHYALIVWGHGTGWRGGSDFSANSPEPVKAVAIDDTTESYMPLAGLGTAVSGKGLSLIGFDTCFASTLEVAYQLKDSNARYMVGAAGMVPSSGWNYTELFDIFLAKPTLTAENFTDAVIAQYAAQYGGISTDGGITSIALSEVKNLFEKFEDFTGTLAESITTTAKKELVLDAILNSVDSYCFTPPADFYIDLYSFSTKMLSIRERITQDSARQKQINDAGIALQTAITAALPSENGQIGVYVIEILAQGLPTTSHSLDYIRGSTGRNKSAFVEKSAHWVPNVIPSAGSLLDKLFYLAF
jgi:hypothetical protein